MVKHSAGPQRSSVSRSGNGSQISGLKDLTLLDGTNQESEENPVLPTPVEDQKGFADSVYLLAAAIFQNTYQEKPAAHRVVSFGKKSELPVPTAKAKASHRMAYELAFNALKYQELLEDIMIDSCFYFAQPMPDDQMSLVAVMLYDFQDRKFFPRECPGEEFIQEVRDTESCLLRFKTKLAASLARCRIKHDLLTIDCLLPESVRRQQQRASRLPLYAWVNALRSSFDEVCGVLKQAGFSQVSSVRQLEGQTFCQDPHCDDMLVFPARVKADLYRTGLLSQYKLIIQDKSCCVGPYVVRPLLAPEGDVLVAGRVSALTVAHTASLLGLRHSPRSSKPRLAVCVGDRPPDQREELQETLANVGCKNVKLIQESFLAVDPADPRLQRVRLILLLPQCSASALSNPVDFILQENGDTDLLRDLSQGAVAQTKLDALVAQQKKSIDHALKFSKVQVVVYSTCSSYPEENEGVLGRALEQNRPAPHQEHKEQPFRLHPPLLVPALRGEAGGDRAADGPFFQLEPSEDSNGCFLAVLTREPEAKEAESAVDVLARAAATGILDGIKTGRPTGKEKIGQPIGQARAAQTRPRAAISSQSRVMGVRNRQIKASSSAPMIGHQGLANAGQLSPPGKSKPRHQRPPISTPSNAASHLSPSSTLQSTTGPSRKSTTSLHISTSGKQHRPSKLAAPQAPANPLNTPAAGSLPGQPQGRQEVIKPVTLSLPVILFPDFPPPNRQVLPPPPLVHQKIQPSLAHIQWRRMFQVPLTRSGSNISRDALVKKPRPWL